MIVDEPRGPRAERFVALVDAGLEAWIARWPVYIGLALASIAVELATAIVFRYDPVAAIVVQCVVDGFVTAFVTIDVAARIRDEPLGLRGALHASLKRWLVVAFVIAATDVIQSAFWPWIFGTPEETVYGIGILPALVVFGILGIATVVAALETRPWYLLPGYAFVRSIIFSGVWPNLGRLVLAGAMLAVPMMLQWLLEHWLPSRGIHGAQNLFWAYTPVDALTLAPFQAFFTYLYFDFVVREETARR